MMRFLLICATLFTLSQALDWYETAIFYQIYPRSFKDSDGDGIGDIRGKFFADGCLLKWTPENVWTNCRHHLQIGSSERDGSGWNVAESDFQIANERFRLRHSRLLFNSRGIWYNGRCSRSVYKG